jgi:hypothetical protein
MPVGIDAVTTIQLNCVPDEQGRGIQSVDSLGETRKSDECSLSSRSRSGEVMFVEDCLRSHLLERRLNATFPSSRVEG